MNFEVGDRVVLTRDVEVSREPLAPRLLYKGSAGQVTSVQLLQIAGTEHNIQVVFPHLIESEDQTPGAIPVSALRHDGVG